MTQHAWGAGGLQSVWNPQIPSHVGTQAGARPARPGPSGLDLHQPLVCFLRTCEWATVHDRVKCSNRG